jgi:hypothetical protein
VEWFTRHPLLLREELAVQIFTLTTQSRAQAFAKTREIKVLRQKRRFLEMIVVLA